MKRTDSALEILGASMRWGAWTLVLSGAGLGLLAVLTLVVPGGPRRQAAIPLWADPLPDPTMAYLISMGLAFLAVVFLALGISLVVLGRRSSSDSGLRTPRGDGQ